MIRNCLFLFLVLAKFSIVNAQKGWLESGATYLKIAVNNDGLYKIEKKDLETSKFNVSNTNNLKLFYRGQEIPIQVKNLNSSKENDLEYILFYGLKNNGDLDSNLYVPKNSRPHSFYSIYSDKSYYFLLQSNSVGKRVEIIQNNSSINSAETVINKEILKVWQESSTFSTITSWAPSLMQSYFEPGEILSSHIINCNKYDNGIKVDNDVFNDEFQLENLIIDKNLKIETEVFSTGRWQNNSRTLNLNFNDSLYAKKKLTGYEFYNFKNQISAENIKNNKLKISVFGSNVSSSLPFDAFTISYIKINYPTSTLISGVYNINSKNGFFELAKNENYNPTIWDISNPLSPKIINFEIVNSKIILQLESNKKTQLLVSDEFNKPISFEQYTYNSIDYTKLNYFILTEKRLLESAQLYKNYRESKQGRNFKVKIIDINDLYNEYSFGEKTPVAIQKWSELFSESGNEEPYLLILGKSYSLTDNLKKNEYRDFVPTIGFPASDMLLTNNYHLLTGRINAVNNDEAIAYLNKLVEFEADSVDKEWSKNFLYLGGGKTTGEYQSIKQLFENLTNLSSSGYIGGNTKMFFKKNLSTSVEDIDITKEINNGVGLLTFCGHSTIQVTDLNFGFASDNTINYSNKGKYPFMFFNGCGSGNIFTDNKKTLSSDWLLTPNKGAIAVLAHSQLSYLSSNSIYMEELHKQWFKNNRKLNITLGKLVKNTGIFVLNKYKDLYNLANVNQMVLQGDPAIRIFNMTKPDLQTEDGQLFLTSILKNKAVSDGDSLKMGVIVSNYGIYEAGTKVNLNLKKEYNDGKIVDYPISINAVAYQDTVFVNLKKELNLKYIIVSVDSDKKVDEIDEANNSGKINFNWEALKNTSYYSTATLVDIVNPNLEVKLEGKLPLNGMKTSQSSVLEIALIDENSFGNKTDKLEVSYRKICDSCPETLTKLDLGNISGEPNEIKATIRLTNLSSGEYEIFIQGYDAKKNSSGDVFTFKFNIVDEIKETSVRVYPNPMSLYTTFEVAIPQKNGTTKANYNINIYNQMGLFVKTIIGDLKTGLNDVYWDAKDNSGNSLPAGQYFYKMMISKDGVIENKGGKIRVFQ